MGGSNIRILHLELTGDGQIKKVTETYRDIIPESIMSGSGDELFEFLASCVAKVVHKGDSNKALGFTFSFPVDQLSLSSGNLIAWTKAFSASGVVGKDVVKLLDEKMKALDLNIRVTALINDTCGTLIAGCYQQKTDQCRIGLILGTGM